MHHLLLRGNKEVFNLLNLLPIEYTVLEIHFWSVNYMLVARICKIFEQNKPW